jgi:hypothetical protein
MNKLVLYIKVIRQLGLRVSLFRIWYTFQNKIGLMFLRFPNKEKIATYCLDEFKVSKKFFFDTKEGIEFNSRKNESLRIKFENIINGTYLFFHSKYYKLGNNYDWLTNPETGYKYDIKTHFSKINDFSKVSGDIKYVWEPSRFSWIYDIIRYDYHFQKDSSSFIFDKIINWIDSNPINMGPNYKCSQEISIRILNWIFALHFYKNSSSLSEQKYNKIINSISCQTEHVYKNINFSRIAVQNNHAITETLTLYIVGLLFPFSKKSLKWRKKGKKWFEQEVTKQIFEDGSYWQHSMNYHRLVVQLLTWALRLAELNDDTFDDIIYTKSRNTLEFLKSFVNPENGRLPNYGANDGSLLFPLNNLDYRDYRGQLNALSMVLNNKVLYGIKESQEDALWYGYKLKNINKSTFNENYIPCVRSFESKGYYIFESGDFFFFIRCGNITGRPGINDNLHIDLWYKGKNIFRDTGSYKYNTTEDKRSFFTGSIAHNVLLVDKDNQIEKGPRFISFGKSLLKDKTIFEISENKLYFEGTIGGWERKGKNISHKRQVFHEIGSEKWEIHDTILNTERPIQQVWNYDNDMKDLFEIVSFDSEGNNIIPDICKGYYSESYGHIQKQKQIVYHTQLNKLKTTITFK